MNQQPHIVAYAVTNSRTGAVTRHKTSARASKAMDRIDNAYGAVITRRRAIWSDQ